MTDNINDGVGTYDVVLLVEQAMSANDAAQVRSLHNEIPDRVVYHVLIPMEDASARIEASLGSLGAGDVMAAPAMVMSEVDLEAVREECRERSDRDPESCGYEQLEEPVSYDLAKILSGADEPRGGDAP